MHEKTDIPFNAVPAKCSACERALDSPLFCGSCRRLYPADGLNCFQLLGLNANYDIDSGAVRTQYFKLMRDIHPDRMATGSADVQRLCLRINAQINEAYAILLDPVLRAEYLLEIAGGKSAADDKHVPQDVLINTLELREEIEQAKADKDPAAIQRLRGQIQDRFDEAMGQIAALARILPGTDTDRKTLRGKLNAVRYFRKMLEAMEGVPA